MSPRKYQSTTPLNPDPVLHRIIDLLKKRNLDEKDLVDHLHLANGTFTGWKYRNGKSYLSHIREIAEYLGVSVGYLLYGTDEDLNGLPEDESEMLQLYRGLDDDGKKHLLGLLRRMK